MASFAGVLRRGRGLPAFAAATLGFMVLVILWGAVVRATGSGAGCGNHWPLCNGDILPRHPRLATLIEFTHRSMSGVCTALVAALVAWTFLARPKGHGGRKAAVASAVLLLTEALLGAVLVKGGFVENNASSARVLMQSVHFTNTMFLLAALTLTWLALRSSSGSAVRSPQNGALAWTSVLFTLVVGATGSVAALADTLFPSPNLRAALAEDFSSAAPLLVRMRWMHPASVLFAGLAALLLCFRYRERVAAKALAAILFAQVLVGTLTVVLLAPVALQVLHLLLADLYWIALVAVVSVELASAATASAAPFSLVEGRIVPV